MDQLRCLRMFVEAVHGESLSAAAKSLGVSTATVSRCVDDLEKRLGFQLLIKTSRQIALTDAGSAYFPRVEQLLEELEVATEYARGFQTEAKGVLRVHARTAVGSICVAPVIPEFLRRHPRLTVQLSLSNDQSPDMIRQQIDVDVRTGVLQDSSLIAKKLASSHRVIVASPAYLSRHGAPQTPRDLQGHNCITYRPDSRTVLWRFRGPEGEEIEMQPHGNLETDNGRVITTSLLAGVGVGQMTDWAVVEHLKSGALVPLLQDYQVTVDEFNHSIYAVFLPNRNHSAKVRAFIDFLAMAFKMQAFFKGFDQPEAATEDA